MRTNSDITVYCKRVVGQEESWSITHIRNVAWTQHYFTIIPNAGLVASVSSLGYVGSQVFSIRIPLHAEMSKTFVTNQEYRAGSNPETTFTFAEGDWVVRGITSAPLKDAILHNLEAVQIRSVHDNRDSRLTDYMQHWRLVG